MTIRFTWARAALLTVEELKTIRRGRKNDLGVPRNQDLEFASVWTHGQPVAALEVHVGLPPEYAPENDGVNVYVHEDYRRWEDWNSRHAQEEAAELRRRLRFLAPGRYSLRVPFPRMDRRYTLAWTPVREQAAAAELRNDVLAADFTRLARAHTVRLLRTFAEVFKDTPLWERATLALYVKAANSGSPEHLGCVRLGTAATPPPRPLPPLQTIDLTSENHLLVQAWWGYMVSVPRPEQDAQAREFGFADHEARLLCVPIRLSLGATNPPPWVLVRVGLEKEAVVGQFDPAALRV